MLGVNQTMGWERGEPEILKLPYFELKPPVNTNQFKIGAVGSDQPRPIRSCGERDEHVEMQIAQLVWTEAFIGVNLSQDAPRLQPVLFGGS